ncbi:hypothetical protein A3D78_04230 [Candidatus Gottesmanbacteria bacterium RIFCSPHIGHO2_02_FULL_39_14]|uniref:Uncharacterized protein n=2 Tax=Candidatus Gottesmaniibacteriota TaxID=1752720 RepID=A0A1F6A0E7_9BACT|nr:MAG: hypothetical protein A3D78_04230 [Candidatus Gottesmanbacteria bacterium RIFCSPHIGHO2_02_FULL_39_14]OGG32390.1 MAG: hypothetical protein A3I51_04530 [Candidatus Gottesmanbacteria bacterium RIFCSPLOWO2_02_FULL_38_8]
MNKYLLLNIAGFNIKTAFYRAKYNHIQSALYYEIEKNLTGFIITTKTPGKCDFYIDIKHVSYHKTLITKEDLIETYYLPYFHMIKNRRLATYYYINLHIFLHILDFILKKLLMNHGFILHASAASINGKANIFLAPSGGGKSTITKFLPDYIKTIGDDNIIIRKHNNEYMVFQTPFEEKNRLNKNNVGYKLKNIYFLKKSTKTAVTKIYDKDQKYKKLLSSILAGKNDIQKIIPTVLLFLDKFDNFYKLEFRKSKKEITEFSKGLTATGRTTRTGSARGT